MFDFDRLEFLDEGRFRHVDPQSRAAGGPEERDGEPRTHVTSDESATGKAN